MNIIRQACRKLDNGCKFRAFRLLSQEHCQFGASAALAAAEEGDPGAGSPAGSADGHDDVPDARAQAPRPVQKTDEFPVLELRPHARAMRERKAAPAARRQQMFPPLPPRYLQQSVDQDWGSVWPAPRTFHPATVPLPVRMGYPLKNKPTPDKWGNAELMKIPNFLHLPPPIVARHCQAIKKFCSKWPDGLTTAEEEQRHFPLRVKKSTYLHSSASVRDERSRVATIQVPVPALSLDYHARDKLLRLVGDRHNPKTDVLTLMADRCPLYQQNLQYCYYLLNVLFIEAQKMEPWEHEKEFVDRELYVWAGSRSEASASAIVSAKPSPTPPDVVTQYRDAVTALLNDGEDFVRLGEYSQAVLKLYGLDADTSHPRQEEQSASAT